VLHRTDGLRARPIWRGWALSLIAPLARMSPIGLAMYASAQMHAPPLPSMTP
jgi:hypothetical protein